MEKKQTILKIITILLVITIAILFVVFYNFSPKNTDNTFNPDKIEPSVEEIEKPSEEINKIKYTTFPKNSEKLNDNNTIINIGGTNNDKILKNFVLGEEIIIIGESNSNNNDVKVNETNKNTINNENNTTINNNIFIAILDKNINLTSTQILEKTNNTTFIDATIFAEGIILVLNELNSTKILLYNENYKLVNEIQIEKIDSGKLYHSGLDIKLISTKNNEISFRKINDSLNITAYTKHKSNNEIVELICYKDFDILITKNEAEIEILKIQQSNNNNQIYYLIEQIDLINGILCNFQIDKHNQNKIYISHIVDNKIMLSVIDIISKKTSSKNTNLPSNNCSIMPLENGYIIHNFLDNTINILDTNFDIIISNISMHQNDKTIKSYYFPFQNKYLFCTECNEDNSTNLCYYNKNFEAKQILSLPKVSSKIDIQIADGVAYIFLSTNNNIREFDTCYGGYDIFILKIKI